MDPTVYYATHGYKIQLANELIPYTPRVLTSTQITSPKKNIRWKQSWYRSAGLSTPDISQNGTWLPIYGLLTEEDNKDYSIG